MTVYTIGDSHIIGLLKMVELPPICHSSRMFLALLNTPEVWKYVSLWAL